MCIRHFLAGRQKDTLRVANQQGITVENIGEGQNDNSRATVVQERQLKEVEAQLDAPQSPEYSPQEGRLLTHAS